LTHIQPTAKSVLVVEDNEVEREGMATILRRQGYEVFTAEDGDRAIMHLLFGPPVNVILLDMLMPTKDGWAVLRGHKRSPVVASTPVVIITGLEIATTEWAKSLGAVACFRKPIVASELLEALCRICGNRPGEAEP
jgi:CheY-like chemotaxis protein